jgi:transposase
VTAAVNVHDATLFPDCFKKLRETLTRLHIDLVNIPLTLDSGFDGKENEQLIKEANMVPIIKPNLRNTKDQEIIKKRTQAFAQIKNTYILRTTVERGFAWEDKYRKLVIRYERLQSTFNGFRYLAATMVNYRTEFGRNAI